MRWTRWTVIALSLGSAVTAAIVMSCAKQENKPTAMTQAQKVERGEMLTWTSGCNDCHTPGTLYGSPDMERRLSGSELGWSGPWGVTYARNLTPDPETGIGNWSEDDIVKAFRTGQRADGSAILPPMPWPGFAHMSDEDAYAIAAYLKSLPPVKHKVPDKLPPGAKMLATTAFHLPMPPPAWDTPRTPPPGASDTTATH